MAHLSRRGAGSLDLKQFVIAPECPVEEHHIDVLKQLKQFRADGRHCRQIRQSLPRGTGYHQSHLGF
jgi:hypothetical protein